MKKIITTILVSFICLSSVTSFAFDGTKQSQNKDIETRLKATTSSPASSYIYSLGDNGDNTILLSMLSEMINQSSIEQRQLIETQRTNRLLESMLSGG